MTELEACYNLIHNLQKRVAELEGFNIGLANESHGQQERIAELEQALKEQTK